MNPSRREFLSKLRGLPVLVTGTSTSDARLTELERQTEVLHEAMVEMISIVYALDYNQRLIIDKVEALEAKIFPSLEQGDDAYG